MVPKTRQLGMGGVLVFAWLLSAGLVLAEPAPSAPPSQPATPPVDLTGLASLSYTFDKDALAAFGPALEQSPVDIDVTADAAGLMAGCRMSNETSAEAAKAGQALCDAISRTGKLRTPVWFAPYMAGGRVALRLGAEKGVVPERPIRFVDPPQGQPLFVFEFGGHCIVGRPSMTAQDGDAVCAAFIAAGRPREEGPASMRNATLGLAVVPGLEPYQVWSGERVADRGAPVYFGVPYSAEEHRLTSMDGRLTSTISPMDYPPRALREKLEGPVSVLIGYDRAGTAQTCRPMRSNNSSFLANASCGVLVAKTRFAFLPTAPTFDGLRYRIVPLTWVIPRD